MTNKKKISNAVFFYMFLAGLLFVVLYPTLSTDYSDRLISAKVLEQQAPLQATIATELRACPVLKNCIAPSHDALEDYQRWVDTSGKIFLKILKHNTSVFLTPNTDAEKTMWTCQSDKPRNVAPECR